MRFRATLIILLLSAGSSIARENPYDLLGKTLAPFINLFVKDAKNPNRAMDAELSLLEMTGLPDGLAGSKVTLALENPDKLRLRVLTGGTETRFLLCRNGQEVRVWPGPKIEALLEPPQRGKKQKKRSKLEDFALPIPEQQLVLLPALFQVQDKNDETINGFKCRVLEATLIPELSRPMGIEEWSALLWVGPENKPVKLTLRKPRWQLTVSFDKLEFSRSLPESTWQPGPEESKDALRLDPGRLEQLLNSATRAWGMWEESGK